MPDTRRTFLQSTLAAAAAVVGGATTVRAIEPIVRTGRSQMRLSIAGYSYRDYFTGKLKPQMTMDDYADLAAEMGLDAIEPTSYYFKPTPEFLGKFKARCTKLGLDISGGAVGNNFCHAEPEKVKEEIAKVKQWIEAYSILGAKTIRIFAGTMPKGDNPEKTIGRCVAAIEEACDHAAKYGILLALENHGGITATAEQLLAIVKAVKHEFFGVNLDTGNFHSADPYAELAAVAPYAVTVQVKTEISRAGQKKEDADLKRIIEILRQVNYRGYVALEYEAAEDPRAAIPRHVEALRKLIQ
jgi:sugar phosphate isomerase/epimerase